jgi:hypothetical protein
MYFMLLNSVADLVKSFIIPALKASFKNVFVVGLFICVHGSVSLTISQVSFWKTVICTVSLCICAVNNVHSLVSKTSGFIVLS